MRQILVGILLLLSTTVPVYGACTLSPSISAIYNGPSETGAGTLSVNYNFPDTTSSTQRTVTVYLDGNSYPNYYALIRPTTVSGTWNLALNATCMLTGEHPIRVTADTCAGTSSAKREQAYSSLTANTTPEITATYDGPDVYGNGNVIVNYKFPHTSSSTQRDLKVYIDNNAYPNYVANFKPTALEGTWTVPLIMACRTAGEHPIRVVAHACPSTAGSGYMTSYYKEIYLSATATTTPEISPTVIGPDANGKATLAIDYKFPGTSVSTDRHIVVYLDGHAWPNYFARSTTFPNVEGTWNVPIDMKCWPPGDRQVRVVGAACPTKNTDSSLTTTKFLSIHADGPPVVTPVFTGPDALGRGSLSIDYSFPNTAATAGRHIVVYLDGNAWPNYHALNTAAEMSGNWTIPIDTACWTEGAHDVRVVANPVCSTAAEQVAAAGTAHTTINVERDPAADLKIVRAIDGTWDAEVTYAFPQTSAASQRQLKLEWLPNGATIATLQPSTQSGTWTFDLPNCTVGSAEHLRVVATSCSTVKAGPPVSVPKCEQSCSLDKECPTCVARPIRITNGNMRMDDSDALPAGELGTLRRTYDSRGAAGVFGKGWTSVFDMRATIWGGTDNRETVYIATETADRYIFARASNGTYKQQYPAGQRFPTTLTYDSTRDVFFHRSGPGAPARVFRGSDGRLAGFRNATRPAETTITYDANGKPVAVADADGGWSWTITYGANGNIATIGVDGYSGLTWTYTYDTQNNLTTVSNTAGTWRTYAYGAAGMEEARDGANKLLESHQYDASGNALTSMQDADDVVDIDYDQPGRVPGETATQVTSATGRQTTYYSRYIAGKMRTVEVAGLCDCGAEDVVYGYDDTGHIVREQDADGYITTRIFNNDRLMEEITALRPSGCDPATDPAQCRFNPDSLLTVTLTATPASTTTAYTYGDSVWTDQPTRIHTSSIVNPSGFRDQEFTYDAVTGHVLTERVKGWTGNPAVEETHVTTTALYDGVAVAAFDPGGVFQSAWMSLPQPAGLRKSIDGPRTDVNDVTTFVYYPADTSIPALLRGRLAAVRNTAGHMTRYESYDVFGSPLRMIDANGVATEMTYDITGAVLTTTLKGAPGCNTALDPICGDDLTTSRTYEASRVAVDHRAGGVTVYTRDALGRVLTISRGPSESDLRERIEYTYDTATGKKSVGRFLLNEAGTWSEKKRESFSYDAQGRLTQILHPDGKSVGYTYDSHGVKTARDENHTQPNTSYTYDAAGRLKEVQQTLSSAPGGSVRTQYTYDGHGNLSAVIDPNGNTTSYVYDDFGRLMQQVSPVSGTTTYAYDPAGNLISTADANGATAVRTYDALNRALTAVSTRGGSSETVTWTYDSGAFGVGRVSSMSDPSGVVTYTYDRRGLLLREQRSAGSATYTTGFGYNAAGERDRIVLPSGRTVQYGFDYAGRPITAALDTTTLVAGSSYLPFGPPAQIAYGNGTMRTMAYDARYRLQTSSWTGAAGTIAAYGYDFDNAGNITRIADLTDDSYTRQFSYDDLNRLITATTGASLWGSASWTYDAMGNVQSQQIGARASVFTYVGNTPKIASATDNNTSAGVSYDSTGNEIGNGAATYTYTPRNHLLTDGARDYAYDGRGVRLTTIDPAAATRRHSLYTPELQLLAETETTTSSTPAIAYEYIWFNGQPLAQINSPTGAIDWYLMDHLGTPIAQTNASATITWRAEYEPYGTLTATRTGATKHQPLRLPGQEALDATDLSYNIFRWYRAGWGRYTQSDPIGLRGGMNAYAYANQNPAQFYDSLGLTCQSNWNFFWDWWLEMGPERRSYGPGSVEQGEVASSPAGEFMRRQFQRGKCRDIVKGSYGTIQSYVETVWTPCDTSFQLGGFIFSAVNVGDCQVRYRIYNTASLYSFFLHMKGMPHKPRSDTSFGYGGNIYQFFEWTEESPCRCCRE